MAAKKRKTGKPAKRGQRKGLRGNPQLRAPQLRERSAASLYDETVARALAAARAEAADLASETRTVPEDEGPFPRSGVARTSASTG